MTDLSLLNKAAICKIFNHTVSASTDTGNDTAPSRDSNSTISFLPIIVTLLSHFDMYPNGMVQYHNVTGIISKISAA